MPDSSDFRTFYELADFIIADTSKDDIAEAVPLLALNVTHYQLRYGVLPIENFTDMLRAQPIDPETAKLLSTGTQDLVGALAACRTFPPKRQIDQQMANFGDPTRDLERFGVASVSEFSRRSISRG